MQKRKKERTAAMILAIQFFLIIGIIAQNFQDLAPIKGKYLNKSASQISNQISNVYDGVDLPRARGGQLPDYLTHGTQHFRVILRSIQVDEIPDPKNGDNLRITKPNGEKNDLEILGLITVQPDGNRNLYRQNRGANDVLFARDLDARALRIQLDEKVRTRFVHDYYIKKSDASCSGFKVKFSLFEYDRNNTKDEPFAAKDFRINTGNWSWKNGRKEQFQQQLIGTNNEKITVFFVVELIQKVSDKMMQDAVCDNDYDLVRELLQRGGNPNAKGILPFAVQNCDDSMMTLLLDFGARPSANDLQEIMCRRNYNRNAVRRLVEYGAVPNDWVLQQAIEYGQEDMVLFFLQNGGIPNDKMLAHCVRANNLGMTKCLLTKMKPGTAALFEAANQNSFPMFAMMIDAGAYLQDNAPIHRAMEFGNFDIVALGLDEGGNVNEALDFAMGINKTGMVQLALDKGANPNLAFPYAVARNDNRLFDELLNRFRGNPNDALAAAVLTNELTFAEKALKTKRTNPNLHLPAAAETGNEPMIRLLIENRADPNLAMFGTIKNDNLPLVQFLIREGATTTDTDYLKMATEKGNFEIVKLLVEKGANPENGIAKAVAEDNLKIADYLLYKGASPYNLIQKSAKNGHARMVGLLIRHGANPNEGMAAAVENDRIEVVELLLKKGAKTGDLIRRPAANGNPRLVKLLLNSDANPNDGMSAAIENNQTEIVGMLLDKGADSKGYLEKAIANDNLKMVELLLENGANANTGMNAAVRGHQNIIVTKLIEFGADAKPIRFMKTAVEGSNPDLIRLLTKNGGTANYRYDSGETFLHLVTRRQHRLSVIIALVEAKANINAKDFKGNTPLHFAVEKGKNYLEITQFLVTNGSDVNAKNDAGKSIFKTAKNGKVKRFLKKNGATRNGY